ncbi:MAG: type II toxin-antitoxin system PemK/MazF family toxin [Micrococcaceae bacterium]
MKRRPAIALSNDLVSKATNMTIVAPISSTMRNFPTYLTLKSTKEIHGKVMLDQTIALDLHAGKVTKDSIIEKVSKEELTEIISIYKLLFSID